MSVALGVALALGACNGGDDDAAASSEGRDGASVTPAHEGSQGGVDDLIDAFCDVFGQCCQAAFVQSGGRAACEAIFDDAALFVALRAGTAVVVEPAFGACVAALRREAETCGLQLEDTSSCATAFMGTKAEGETCEEAVECVRGQTPVLCVKIGDPEGPEPHSGACHTLTRAARGEPCQFSAEARLYANFVRPADVGPLLGYCDRADGLRCDASRTCVPLHGVDEACLDHAECLQGLYCDQTCRPTQPEGAACAESIECNTGLLCIEGRCAVYAPEADPMACAPMTALPPVF